MRIGKYEIAYKWNHKWSPWERAGCYVVFLIKQEVDDVSAKRLFFTQITTHLFA